MNDRKRNSVFIIIHLPKHMGLFSSLYHDGDGLNLQQKLRSRQMGYLHVRARRQIITEKISEHVLKLGHVPHVGHENRHADDIG